MRNKFITSILSLAILFAAPTSTWAADSTTKNLNEKPLLENLKGTNNTGVMPFLNPVEDFAVKKDYSVDSWFYIGHVETEGHKLNYLFHLMLLKGPGEEPSLNSVVSMTDETTGWYYGEDKMYPLSSVYMSESQDGANSSFSIKVPNGSMTGNLDKIHIEATMPHGKIDVDLKPYGLVLYNGGTGYFPLLGMNIHEYSIPNLVTTGKLTFDDKTYDINNGTTWFDRQWQMQNGKLDGHWSWMDINLDNGDAISLWGVVDNKNGKETAWATILHPDGSQNVVAVEPLSVGSHDYWTSTKTGQVYPSYWVVKIPDLDATLEVTPSPKEQEIAAVSPMLNKYEGASAVQGSYKGKKVKGHCYVELVGQWK